MFNRCLNFASVLASCFSKDNLCLKLSYVSLGIKLLMLSKGVVKEML